MDEWLYGAYLAPYIFISLIKIRGCDSTGHLGTLLFSSPSFIPRTYVERERGPTRLEGIAVTKGKG